MAMLLLDKFTPLSFFLVFDSLLICRYSSYILDSNLLLTCAANIFFPPTTLPISTLSENFLSHTRSFTCNPSIIAYFMTSGFCELFLNKL